MKTQTSSEGGREKVFILLCRSSRRGCGGGGGGRTTAAATATGGGGLRKRVFHPFQNFDVVEGVLGGAVGAAAELSVTGLREF